MEWVSPAVLKAYQWQVSNPFFIFIFYDCFNYSGYVSQLAITLTNPNLIPTMEVNRELIVYQHLN